MLAIRVTPAEIDHCHLTNMARTSDPTNARAQIVGQMGFCRNQHHKSASIWPGFDASVELSTVHDFLPGDLSSISDSGSAIGKVKAKNYRFTSCFNFSTFPFSSSACAETVAPSGIITSQSAKFAPTAFASLPFTVTF